MSLTKEANPPNIKMHTGQGIGKNLALPKGESGHHPQFLESNMESLGISWVTAPTHSGPLRSHLTSSGGKVPEIEFNPGAVNQSWLQNEAPVNTGHRSSGVTSSWWGQRNASWVYSMRFLLWLTFCTPSQQRTTAWGQQLRGCSVILSSKVSDLRVVFRSPLSRNMLLVSEVKAVLGTMPWDPVVYLSREKEVVHGKTCSTSLKIKEVQIKIRSLFLTFQAGKT